MHCVGSFSLVKEVSHSQDVVRRQWPFSSRILLLLRVHHTTTNATKPLKREYKSKSQALSCCCFAFLSLSSSSSSKKVLPGRFILGETILWKCPNCRQKKRKNNQITMRSFSVLALWAVTFWPTAVSGSTVDHRYADGEHVELWVNKVSNQKCCSIALVVYGNKSTKMPCNEAR